MRRKPRFAHLETEPALLDTQMADLTEVPGIDVRPGVSFPTSRVLHVPREVLGVLVGLDHVTNSESVDVDVWSTDVEGLGGELANEFTQCI